MTEHADQPNVARIYDYLLGGKAHFAADRLAAERLIAAQPDAQLPPVPSASSTSPQAALLAGVGRKRP